MPPTKMDGNLHFLPPPCRQRRRGGEPAAKPLTITTMPEPLTLKVLQDALARRAAAFRCRRTLQPAGGEGTKIFPPTYAGATYNTELRRIGGASVPCVVVDSVQSQANRMEEALQQAVDDGRIALPVVSVRFPDPKRGDDATPEYPIGRITSLQAPHRLADAILRDSLHDGTPFRESEVGKSIDGASMQNATPLYELGPTCLVFGMWDSTGPRGGLGFKIERALVSEIVGINCPYLYDEEERRQKLLPRRHGIRRDPLNVSKHAFITKTGERSWINDEREDEKSKDKRKQPANAKRPSEINHGNVPFGEKDEALNAGVTVDSCEQTTTLSLIALQRLNFPDAAGKTSPQRDAAAQAVLAAIALCAAALAETNLDLRSRCLLWPEGKAEWQLLATPGEDPKAFTLDRESATALLKDAVAAAEKAGVAWRSEVVELTPSPELVKLVARSQRLEAQAGEEAGEA